MKTINEYAREYEDSEFNGSIKDTINDAVEFAQRWYSFTSHELPQIGIEIIVKNKVNHKNIVTPSSHESIHYLSEKYTHWRCIELK